MANKNKTSLAFRRIKAGLKNAIAHARPATKRKSNLKIIVEKHPDAYVTYPLGLKGVVVGQGDTYEQALADVKSAIRFHVKTFGPTISTGFR